MTASSAVDERALELLSGICTPEYKRHDGVQLGQLIQHVGYRWIYPVFVFSLRRKAQLFKQY
jgi:hypothetical protein